MKCPFCAHLDTQVVETRVAEDGDFVRRRRQCATCEKRFTTYERPDVNYPAVVKKDGRRIEFDRSKLQASMNLSLRKRPVSTEQVDSALERIEEKVLAAGLRVHFVVSVATEEEQARVALALQSRAASAAVLAQLQAAGLPATSVALVSLDDAAGAGASGAERVSNGTIVGAVVGSVLGAGALAATVAAVATP
jgi:transcriptional regulator NrdR